MAWRNWRWEQSVCRFMLVGWGIAFGPTRFLIMHFSWSITWKIRSFSLLRVCCNAMKAQKPAGSMSRRTTAVECTHVVRPPPRFPVFPQSYFVDTTSLHHHHVSANKHTTFHCTFLSHVVSSSPYSLIGSSSVGVCPLHVHPSLSCLCRLPRGAHPLVSSHLSWHFRCTGSWSCLLPSTSSCRGSGSSQDWTKESSLHSKALSERASHSRYTVFMHALHFLNMLVPKTLFNNTIVWFI